uniref:Uncharacterized protein n=1 Tax=Eutreptiella gymnastica TaxID=73025 RepID=A0A7S4G693_9EUGL
MGCCSVHAVCPPHAPTQWVDNPPTYPCVEDFLLQKSASTVPLEVLTSILTQPSCLSLCSHATNHLVQSSVEEAPLCNIGFAKSQVSAHLTIDPLTWANMVTLHCLETSGVPTLEFLQGWKNNYVRAFHSTCARGAMRRHRARSQGRQLEK